MYVDGTGCVDEWICWQEGHFGETRQTGCTICPRSSDPFYIVSYFIKWVTTSWTHSIGWRKCMWIAKSRRFVYCISKKPSPIL